MRNIVQCFVLGAALLVSGTATSQPPAPAAAPPTARVPYFESAAIAIGARANADGYLRVRLLPQGGAPREVAIAIERRMSENDIAKALTAALTPVLGPDYEVDRDGGEKVKLRKVEKSAANFSVEITINAPGFSIVLEN